MAHTEQSAADAFRAEARRVMKNCPVIARPLLGDLVALIDAYVASVELRIAELESVSHRPVHNDFDDRLRALEGRPSSEEMIRARQRPICEGCEE